MPPRRSVPHPLARDNVHSPDRPRRCQKLPHQITTNRPMHLAKLHGTTANRSISPKQKNNKLFPTHHTTVPQTRHEPTQDTTQRPATETTNTRPDRARRGTARPPAARTKPTETREPRPANQDQGTREGGSCPRTGGVERVHNHTPNCIPIQTPDPCIPGTQPWHPALGPAARTPRTPQPPPPPHPQPDNQKPEPPEHTQHQNPRPPAPPVGVRVLFLLDAREF